jgi:hypothetical protein
MKSSTSKSLLLALLAFAGTAPAVHAVLPAEYYELEYIASSGEQYIDTGIRATTTTRLVLDFRYTSMPTAGSYNGYTHGSSNGHFGHTLRVGSPKHAVSPNAVSPNDASQIVYDGGEIIWQQPETILMVR